MSQLLSHVAWRAPSQLLLDWRAAPRLRVALLLLGEVVVCAAVVLRVRYTPIDWRAYMQEVEGPMVHGVWDYTQLRGETGPLVYPAGFVYLYTALRALAGGDGSHIRAAQWALAAAYVGTHGCVASVYGAVRSAHVPPWTLLLLCTSLRLHSIYVLRLFNDCWAMLLFWAAVALFARGRWRLGCVAYSLGTSIKMNVLLSAPGLLLLLLQAHGVAGAASHIGICAAVQLALAAPFLRANFVGYVVRAFLTGFGDLNQKWSVNWKMLPHNLFASPAFTCALLAAHLALLALLASRRWTAPQGGVSRALGGARVLRPPRLTAAAATPTTSGTAGGPLRRTLHPEHIVTVLLGCNAAGVLFSRSLRAHPIHMPLPPCAEFLVASLRYYIAPCARRLPILLLVLALAAFPPVALPLSPDCRQARDAVPARVRLELWARSRRGHLYPHLLHRAAARACAAALCALGGAAAAHFPVRRRGRRARAAQQRARRRPRRFPRAPRTRHALRRARRGVDGREPRGGLRAAVGRHRADGFLPGGAARPGPAAARRRGGGGQALCGPRRLVRGGQRPVGVHVTPFVILLCGVASIAAARHMPARFVAVSRLCVQCATLPVRPHGLIAT